MIFIKKAKMDVNMRFVDAVVKRYFEVLRGTSFELDCAEISELLRYSVCRMLGLKTMGYTSKIVEYSRLVVPELSDAVENFNVHDMTEEYKMGLLEACVISMEMARKNV